MAKADSILSHHMLLAFFSGTQEQRSEENSSDVVSCVLFRKAAAMYVLAGIGGASDVREHTTNPSP